MADELDKARSGKAYGEAKPYVGGGPQPIVIFMADEVGKLLGNLVSVNR
ncbi:hypothetical protein [Kribbella sp. NPDC048915]